jgi:hypothetical protein
MSERFAARMNDDKVAHDTFVVADFIRIYCDAHHADRERRPVRTDAAALGVYERKHPSVCEECEAHLAYAEKRRAYCPKDPKPFCAHCDSQCYRPDELTWQHDMMRFAGPKSWREGHMIDGIRHAVDGIRWKREMVRRARSGAASGN